MSATPHRDALRRTSEIAPPEELYTRIRGSVETVSAAKIRTGLRIATALVSVPLLIATVVLGASELVYHRPTAGLELGVHSTLTLFAVLSLIVLVTLASTLIALWRGNNGLGARAPFLAGMVVLVAPIYAALILPAPVHSPDAAAGWVNISPWGTRCFLIAMAVGAIVLVGFSAALRRAVPVASRLRAAAIGSAAGAWAGLAVFVFCPSGDPQHLLVGHVLPAIALVSVGVALARVIRP